MTGGVSAVSPSPEPGDMSLSDWLNARDMQLLALRAEMQELIQAAQSLASKFDSYAAGALIDE